MIALLKNGGTYKLKFKTDWDAKIAKFKPIETLKKEFWELDGPVDMIVTRAAAERTSTPIVASIPGSDLVMVQDNAAGRL